MATRQYIGARYTIKIYENSQNPASAAWESGFPYERLTMVQYNNDTYVSKKDVPSNVGNPAENAQYWVQTGFYNGQISVLQEEINELEKFVNGRYQNFANRKFAFATDSWMNIINDHLVPMMGLTLSDVIRISCSGGGFVQANPDSETFLTKLSAQPVDTEVTDFLVIGGQNDAYGNQAALDVESAMNTYFNIARTKYPNATFYFVPCQHITDTIAHATKYLIKLIPVFEKVCAENAVKYYPNATYIINKISMVSGDRQHTSSAGAAVIATYLLNALLGGDISVQSMEETVITTSTINGVLNAYIKTNNSYTELMAAIGNTAGAWEFLTTKTIGDLVNTRNALANIADVGGLLVNAWDFRETVPVLIVTGSGKYMTAGLFELRNGGDITVQLLPDMSAHSSETIQYMQIMKPLYLTGNTYFIA